MKALRNLLICAALAEPIDYTFAFIPRCFPKRVRRRPSNDASVLYAVPDLLGDNLYATAEMLGVSTVDLLMGIPLAGLGAAMAASQVARIRRDKLRNDLGYKIDKLFTKQGQLIATSQQANVSIACQPCTTEVCCHMPSRF